MVGFGVSSRRARAASEIRLSAAAASAEARFSANSEMSAPDTKALPPAPLTTMTRIASSRSKSSRMDWTASHISSETALRRAGLLKIRWPTAPSFLAIILSVMGRSGMVSSSDDAARAQIGDRVIAVAELAQDRIGVLAELGGRAQRFGLRRAAHIDRLADDADRAELRVVDRPRHCEMLHLRIGKDLVDRIDRPARHADLVQQRDPVGARAGPRDRRDPLVERLAILRAQRPGRVIGVVQQLLRPRGLAEAAPQIGARGGDVDLPVGGRKDAGRDPGRMVVAGLPRDLMRDQPARGLEVEHEDLGFA